MYDLQIWRSNRLSVGKFAVLVLLSCAGVRGFAQVTTADVNGTVTDVSGAVLRAATVTIRNLDTQEVRTTHSSDSGSYTLFESRAGDIHLVVTRIQQGGGQPLRKPELRQNQFGGSIGGPRASRRTTAASHLA